MVWPLKLLGIALALFCIHLISQSSGLNYQPSLLPESGLKQDNYIRSNLPPVASAIQSVSARSVIRFRQLHQFLDSLGDHHLPQAIRKLSAMIISWENPWLLDSIRSFDYYRARKNGMFIWELDSVPIFGPEAKIHIPDSIRSLRIAQMITANKIVLNIPEFRIWVTNGSDTLCSCPVRVGRNERALLETIGHEIDLRTPVGSGKIIRVRKHPLSKNLHTGEPYVHTRRDDGRLTRMPDIPSLEPILDGNRWGKLIHATTNQATLGRAYSHGCVGVTEACMWTMYFLAPEGTAVEFRYDLRAGLLSGKNAIIADIYHESPSWSAEIRD